MGRWKSLLPQRLVVPLVILGSAFVFWRMVHDTPPPGVSKRRSALPVGPSSLLKVTQRSEIPVATPPAAPRLLSHTETCGHRASTAAASSSEPVRPVVFPLISETAEPSAAEPLELAIPLPSPTDARVDEDLALQDTPSATSPDRLSNPLHRLAAEEQRTREARAREARANEARAREARAREARARETRAEASGPRYSWLLEGQANVPTQTYRRSRELERIAQQADAHTRRGFDLAGRRAYFSARAEFIKALRLVAQGLDIEHQTTVHCRALRAGLAALAEADDFVPSGTQFGAELNFQTIINGHGTPVLKLSRPQILTSIEALRRYYGFAQYQLAVAAGREVAGSMALHALAKLYASSEDNPTLNIISAKSKAMTCFQAALIVYPQNYMASNDLGVLLANSGRFDDARMVLEGSATNCPHSTTWNNLSVVYRELGMNQAASRAEENRRASLEQEMAQRNARSPGASDPRVVWLSPEEFAKTYARMPDARQPLPVRSVVATSAAQHAQVSVQVAGKQSPAVDPEKSTGWSWNIFKKVLK